MQKGTKQSKGTSKKNAIYIYMICFSEFNVVVSNYKCPSKRYQNLQMQIYIDTITLIEILLQTHTENFKFKKNNRR